MTTTNTFRGSNGAAYAMQPDGTCVRVDKGDSPLAHLDLGRQIAARCAIIDGAPLERIRDARVREAVRAIRADRAALAAIRTCDCGAVAVTTVDGDPVCDVCLVGDGDPGWDEGPAVD